MQKFNLKLFKEIKKENLKIVIFGAGRVARIVLEKLLCNSYDIECLVVTSLENNRFHILGKPVLCIDELPYKQKETVFLLCVSEEKQEIIEQFLHKKGYDNIYGITNQLFYQWEEDLASAGMNSQHLYLKRYVEPYSKMLEDIYEAKGISLNDKRQIIVEKMRCLQGNDLNIPRLVIVLGTKCSLRCKDCNNLMPLFKPQEDTDVEKTIHSLSIIEERATSILKCELIGGEPFLSKSMERILTYVINSQVIKNIEITTNGTIIPSEKILPLLKNSKVLVRISDYGNVVNKDRIIYFLEINAIQYIVLELGKWTSPGGIKQRNRDKETLKKLYDKCPSGYYCKTLYEDKLFACARAASLHKLGYMPDEYVEVNDHLNSETIKNFLLRDYSIACDYCDISSDEAILVEPAEQVI